MTEIKEAKRSHKPKRVGYGAVSAVLVTVFAFFAAQISAVVAIISVLMISGKSMAEIRPLFSGSTTTQFFIVLLTEVSMLWIIYKFLQYRKVALSKIGIVRPKSKDVPYAVAGFVVYYLILVVATVLVSALVPGLDLNQKQELGFKATTSGLSLWLVFASLVFMPPIAEEIVCRGFLYTGLKSNFRKITAAIITSIIFAIAHLQIGSGNSLLWLAAVDTFVLSMVLVYLREKTNSLWASIMVHMLKNGFAFLVLFVLKR